MRWKTALRWLAGLLVVAAACAAAARPLARGLIEREGLRAGIDLRRYDLELGWRFVVLRDVSFRLAGAESVRGRADELRIEHGRLAPTRAEARGLTITLAGSAGRVLRDLQVFARTYPAALAIPLRADRADLSFRDHAGDPPWLAAAGPLETGGGRGVLDADRSLAIGRELGPVRVAWYADGSGLHAELGGDGAPAPVRALVTPGDADAGLEIEWDPIPLASAPLPESLLASVRGATLKGSASLRLGTADEPAPARGSVKLELIGFVPPHPKDLDAIVFGDRTTIGMNVEIDEKRERLRLTDVALAAGALALKGRGSGERIAAGPGSLDEAIVELDLAGAIPCTSLSYSVTTARFGPLAGKIAGDLARRTLDGSVAVEVSVRADSRARPAFRFEPSFKVGCRVRGF